MARSTRGAFGTSPCRTAVTSNGALQDVAPDGTVTDVTAGYLRASLRAVDESASESGAPSVPAPHRMRLVLTSDDPNFPAMMTFRHASAGTSSLNRVAATSRCSCLSPPGRCTTGLSAPQWVVSPSVDPVATEGAR